MKTPIEEFAEAFEGRVAPRHAGVILTHSVNGKEVIISGKTTFGSFTENLFFKVGFLAAECGLTSSSMSVRQDNQSFKIVLVDKSKPDDKLIIHPTDTNLEIPKSKVDET